MHTKIKLSLVVCVALGGCGGLTQTQTALSKLDESAHSVSTTQMMFFRVVQASECKSKFLSAVYNWSQTKAGGLDLTPPCVPTVLTEHQLQIRQDLMNSITVYADQLQSLAADGDDKTLVSNSQDLASKLNSFAKQHGFSSGNSGIAADVEAAIIGVTNLVLDHVKVADIKAAAIAQDGNLTKIVSVLKNENQVLADAVDGGRGLDRSELTTIVNGAKTFGRSQAFFAAIQAQMLLTSPIGTAPAASNPQSQLTNVGQLNAALDGIVTANHAIATVGPGGVWAAVSDLATRAQLAQSLQAALSK